MVLPMSMTPSGPDSFIESSTSAKDDSSNSFKLFLDLITPAEFSRLLRARVKYLLKTWPPQSASTIGAASSSSPTSPKTSPPSFESVRAFAAFFRTQDSPGPSPIDLSAPTSMQALYHHLIALQTLLSFLSGRELQDIVRARLAEGGKDRSIAIQGLIDIMRNAGGEDPVENLASMDGESEIIDDQSAANDGNGVEVVNGSIGSTSDINVAERQASAKDNRGSDGEVHGRDLLIDKRERLESNEVNHEIGDRVAVKPGMRQPPQITPSSGSHVINSYSSPVYPGSDSNYIAQKPVTLPEPPMTKESKFSSYSEKSTADDLSQACMKSPRQNVGNFTNIVQNNNEKNEGLPVTQMEENRVQSTSRLQPAVLSLPKGPSPALGTESATPCSGIVSPSAGLPPTRPKPVEEQQVVPIALDPDPENCPGPGVSRAEWNRKRFRAAIGLPPKEPEPSHGYLVDSQPSTSLVPAAEGDQPQDKDTSSGMIPMTSESPRVMTNPVVSASHTTSFDSTRTHVSASSTSYLETHASRSPSPSVHDSELDDRASPPGPILRAVDWASRVVPPSLSSEMEVDELDEQDGSEDTLAMGNGGTFDLGINTEGAMKSNATVFNKGHVYRGAQMSTWAEAGEVVGDGLIWNNGDENGFGGNDEVDKAGEDATGEIGSREKIFIRLPARKGGRGDTGMTSTGTDVSASASASGSPGPPSPPRHGAQSSEKNGLDYSRGTNPAITAPLTDGRVKSKGDEDVNGFKQAANIQPPSKTGSSIPVVGAPSGSTTNTSSRPPSQTHSQAVSTTHTPNSCSSALQPGQHHLHGHHSQGYPPPPHTHPYPGWFGAMFYVPFGGPSHLGPHPHTRPATSPHPHSQSSPQAQPPQLQPPHHHMQQQQRHPHLLSRPGMQSKTSSPQIQMPPNSLAKQAGGSPCQVAGENVSRFSAASNSESRSELGPESASASGPTAPPRPGAVSPPIPPPEGPKRNFKRKPVGELNDSSASNAEDEDGDVKYTDEVGVKESPLLKRRCFNCHAVQAPSWRKSKLNSGKILCNKCGIYESTHMTARPLKTRPRRSSDGGAGKKRKPFKKTVQAPPP